MAKHRFKDKAELLAHIAEQSKAYYAKNDPVPEREMPRVAARLEAEAAFAEAARQGIGANGPPPSLAEQIRELGEASYEAGWFGQTAVDVCVDPRTLRRWMDGEGEATADAVRLARLTLEARLEKIVRILARHRSYSE